MNAIVPPKGLTMKSHYSDAPKAQPVARHTLSVLVDNEPGVLARIAGLFSGRGYNIESLTVSETQHEQHVSRITIVTAGTADVIEQIKHQLDRLIPVHRVIDARTLDATVTSFVFELTGNTEEIERFIRLMGEVGLVEVSRTGIAAMSRGAEAL